jgi:sensor histidine kinase regulating citrate/malate metabolism
MKQILYKNYFAIMSGILLAIILVLGVWSTWYLGKKVEMDERNSLLLRTQTIAAMIEHSDLKELRGDTSDLAHPAYIKLKKIMERVHSINKDTRFVYIMGIRDNQQFFYVDSENPNSPDYSYPGQIYTDASVEDIENHLNGITYTKGPYTDAWGRWFTAYAPVLDENNAVLGLVGMDIEAEHLLLRISIVRKATAIISGLVFLCALTLILLGKKSIKHTT